MIKNILTVAIPRQQKTYKYNQLFMWLRVLSEQKTAWLGIYYTLCDGDFPQRTCVEAFYVGKDAEPTYRK